jgi:MYXO-CTERM domain-containing protein
MQAADQTPPTLPAIPAPMIHYADDTSDGVGCGGAKCGDVTYVGIAAVATDDTTDRYRIGYRFSLESGTLPSNFALPTTAVDPNGDVVRIFFNAEIDSFDFTLQVVAIDLAGNESAPQSVRVVQTTHACAVAGAPTGGSRFGWLVLAAGLVLAARRRCRR